MVTWFLICFGFWCVLSQKWDFFHLSLGALSSGIATWMALTLRKKPDVFPTHGCPLFLVPRFPWLRFLAFLPHFFVELFKANWQVLKIVLAPKLKIEPRFFEVRANLPDVRAQWLLANAITLTPGTVTVSVDEDCFLIHGLTEDAQSGLSSDSPQTTLVQRVEKVFLT